MSLVIHFSLFKPNFNSKKATLSALWRVKTGRIEREQFQPCKPYFTLLNELNNTIGNW